MSLFGHWSTKPGIFVQQSTGYRSKTISLAATPGNFAHNMDPAVPNVSSYATTNAMTSDEINVGLNGIGRIGKCLLMQMTKNPRYRIRAINCSSLKADQYADYLRYDSSHKFSVRMGLQKVEVLSPTRIRIVTDHSTNDVTLFSSRDPKELPWKSAGVEYLLDATGAFLTQEKCANHDVGRVVMTAPPKDPDLTDTFIYGVNHEVRRHCYSF